jgi:hypothetical protein
LVEKVLITNDEEGRAKFCSRGKVHPCTGTEAPYRPYGR